MGEGPVEDEVKVCGVVTLPRRGHADLIDAIIVGHQDMGNVLERFSARGTLDRVAAGADAKIMLRKLGTKEVCYVKQIAGIRAEEIADLTMKERQEISENSPVRVLDGSVEQEMCDAIDQAKKDGDSIGGVCEVYIEGVPAGVGSYVHYDRKLDAK